MLIYVCAKYKGDIERNIDNARDYANFVMGTGEMPLCVHLFLNDMIGVKEDEFTRPYLLELCKRYVFYCDELWVFEDDEISEGMKIEIDFAKRKGMNIRYLKVRDLPKIKC